MRRTEIRESDVWDLYIADELDLVVVKNYFPPNRMRSVATRFWSSQRREIKPPAGGSEIGTSHYAKEVDEYFSIAAASAPLVDHVVSSVVAEIHNRLSECLAGAGIAVRPARHDGRDAPPCVIRSWESSHGSPYALVPHDDSGQLSDPNQIGFEVQEVAPHDLIATNICVERISGGDFILWDYAASSATRETLGISELALPYPQDFLTRCDRVVVDMDVGDVVMFRGEFIHAVTSSPRRVVCSYFSGRVSDDSVAVWS